MSGYKSKILRSVLVCALLWAVVIATDHGRIVPARAQGPAPPKSPTGSSSPPAPVPAPAQDEDMERVETDLVSVLFNAVDKRRSFVTTLKRDDLRVFEDNAPQQIASFERETALPLSLAILIDVSTSQQESLADEQDAARGFIDSILRPEKDKVAILSFTGTATIEQDLTNDRAALQHAIDEVQIVPPAQEEEAGEYNQAEQQPGDASTKFDETGLPGSTALWDAVWATANELLAPTPQQTRRAIILITDGDDSTSRLSREEAVTAAVRANALIYAIGIDPVIYRFNKKALRKVAEATGGRAFFPKDLPALNAAFAQIQQELRTQYLVAYAPTNKAHDGSYRRIRLELSTPELKKQGVRLAYREGYFARRPGAQPAARRAGGASKRLARPPRRPRKS